MKKVFSLVLVLTMVLGVFSIGFATPNDVGQLTKNIDDSKVVKAVERLSAFGIVNGMEDGEYHPEQEITREQFAKLVVEALGLGEAAEAAKGQTNFTDVKGSKWSSGYINVATGQDIVKGMGNGTFHPQDKVTYAQAVTMLVRALGYQDEFLSGSWPGNYVSKAAQLDITDGIKFATSGFANRGDAAVLVDNTLDAKIIKVKSYTANNPEYEETEITLLEDSLDLDKVENLRVVEVPELNGNLKSDELNVIALKDDVVIDGKGYDEYDVDDNDRFIKVNFDENSISLTNPQDLLGMEITGYFDDDELVYAQVETDSKDVFRCIAYDDEGDGTMYIWNPNKYYDWDSSAVVYINGEKVDPDLNRKGKWLKSWDVFSEYTNSDTSYAFAKRIVVDGDEVVFADMAISEEVNLLVTNVNESKKRIEYVLSYDTDISYSDTKKSLDLDTDLELKLDDYDEYDIYAQDGTKLELSDIEEYNVIYYYEDEEDDCVLHILVADPEQAVTGELKKVKVGRNCAGFTRSRATIDDNNYYVANRFAYTDDDLDHAKGVHRYSLLNDEWEDSFGEDVSIYRDFKGRIAFMTTDTETANDDYGVVIGTDKRYHDNTVKLWTMDDVKDVYDYDSDSDVAFKNIEDGAIVKYSLNKAGDEVEIEEAWNIEEKNGKYYVDGKVLPTLSTKDTFEKDAIRVNGTKYYNESGSVYLNYADYFENDLDDAADLDVVKWSDLDDTNADPGCYVLAITDEDHDKDIDLMVFVNDYDNISDEDQYVGYIAEMQINDEEMELTVDVSDEGIKEYVLDDDDDAFDDIEYSETFIVFREKGENGLKLDAFGKEINTKSKADDYDLVGHLLDYDNVYGYAWVIDRDGKDVTIVVGEKDKDGNFEFGKEETYKISKDTPIYCDDDKASYTDLDFGYVVEFVKEDGEIKALKYWEAGDMEDSAVELSGNKRKYDLENSPESEDPDEETTEGEVTFVNADEGLIEVDDKVLELDARVRLVDANGKTVAIGPNAVAAELEVGDVLAEITEKGGVVTEMKLDEEEEPEEVDKKALAKAITNAEKALEDNDKVETAETALQEAIDTAKAVNDDKDATQNEVDEAVEDLNEAVETFEAAENAEEEDAIEGTYEPNPFGKIVVVEGIDFDKVEEVKVNDTKLVENDDYVFADDTLRIFIEDKSDVVKVTVDGTEYKVNF